MRFLLSLVIILSLGLPAAAQTPPAHHPTPAPAAKPAPAKPAATIIPGSPLAALTGGGAPAKPEPAAPAPFGTGGIGLSFTGAFGKQAAHSFGEFASAIQQSTRLQPVLSWLESFPANAPRRAGLADIVMGLIITVLPGLAAEEIFRLALSRPRASLARRALPRPGAAPTGEEELEAEPEEDGIADAEAGETEKRPRRRVSLLAWGRRLLFGVLHFGLCLASLVAFAVTVQVLIWSGVLTTRPAHLAVIGITNIYLLCRLVHEFARFLVEPNTPSLRLIAMPSIRAKKIMRGVALLLATGFIGYVLVSVGEVLGLSRTGGSTIARLAALLVHIELAVIVWQSRRVVGRWIAGKPDAKGGFAGLRHFFGRIWFIPALFYILALWVALAAGVHDAFQVLLRVVLVAAGASILGRLAWKASTSLLERAFPDPTTATARHPALYARARAYNPLIRLLVRVIIAFFVVVLVLQGWGVNAFGFLASDKLSRALIGAIIDIVITVAVSLVAWEWINATINNRIDRLQSKGRTRQAARLRTLLPMLKATIGVSICIVAGLICLSKIGVNAAPLLAGASVLGIAIGFGSQKLVQDVITGLFLLLEDAIQVGDNITLAGMTGTVERLSIRTIRLRGGDGSVNIIPFSAVTTVTNSSRDFGNAQISVQVGYDEDLSRVYAVLTDIVRTMRQEPAWSVMIRDDLQIFGLDQFGASALVITGQIRTGPGQHVAVRREFNARMKARFAAEGIEIPYAYLPPPPKPEPEPAAPEKAEKESTLPPGG